MLIRARMESLTINTAINMFENCCMGGASGALEPTVPLFPDVEDSCLDRKPFKSCAK